MAFAGPKNRTGPEGPKGDPGKKGANGKTPAFDIGEVRSGSKAKVWLTGDALNVILNFILPKGDKGEKGEQGRHGSPGYVVESTTGGGSGSGARVVDTFNTSISTSVKDFVVVTTANTVEKISDNLTATMPNGIFGVCLNKPTATTADVLFLGRVPGFSGLTSGLPVFVSDLGAPTHVVPSTGMVQQIGFATSATEIFVNLLQPMRRN